MASLYLVKDNLSVNLGPSGRIEETLTNDLFAAERGISPRLRNRILKKTSGDRDFSSATGACMTRYAIQSITGVFDNSGGTGTNYYTGGSFSWKTVYLGNVTGLHDGDTLWVTYVGKSGDTIVVDSGKVRDNYIITGNLVSDANGSMQTKKDNLRTIFLGGGNVALTYPTQNNSVNVFPTRLTFVENAGEINQSEIFLEAVFGHNKV